MGCRLSSIYGEERPTISKEQSKILSSTWHGIHSDLEKIGLLMFMGMFDNHPETKQFFGLSGGPMMSEDPKVVQKIQEHGLRFMSIARKLVANLDDPEKFDAILLDLGKRHHTYQADINLVDTFGQHFIASIRPTLKNNWSEAVENAWEQLFKCIAYRMKQGLTEAATEAIAAEDILQ
ncbi:neuroglobin-like isoform X2 [Ptychodera flava]|uniref:neuroglobin-like isoform X2 n=1 Tax=Ptychodera flava TaxID=63121 RepID=UPI00396A4D9F